MIRRRILPSAAMVIGALMLGGCPAPTETQIRPLGIAPEKPANAAAATADTEETPPVVLPPIAGADGYVLIAERVHNLDDEDAISCIAGAIASEAPVARMVPSQLVYDSLFPWLEPGTKPRDEEGMLELTKHPLVRSRLPELGVRYLVHVGGGRLDGPYRDNWACTGAGCASLGFQDMGAQLSVTVYDVKAGASLGGVAATSRGRAVNFTLGIVPIMFIPYTGSRVCTEVGDAVAKAFGAGTPPPAPQPR